jgi:hypothetical protein
MMADGSYRMFVISLSSVYTPAYTVIYLPRLQTCRVVDRLHYNVYSLSFLYLFLGTFYRSLEYSRVGGKKKKKGGRLRENEERRNEKDEREKEGVGEMSIIYQRRKEGRGRTGHGA